MPSELHIGSSSLIGALERYSELLDLLEVSTEANALPPPKRLKKWRESVGDEFHFSVVLPRSLSSLPATGAEAELEAALEAARALQATWLVLRTLPSVTPTDRSRRRLRELFEKLQGAAPRLAWEPRGLWTPEDAEACADGLGVTLVRDLAQADAPESPIAYTRLRSLGQQSRIGQGAIERVAERLEDVEVAFVVVEGRGAPGVARRLRAELGIEDQRGLGEDEDEDEGEGDEGDEDENDDE